MHAGIVKAVLTYCAAFLLLLMAGCGGGGAGALPIVFIGQAAVAGKYLLEASVEGYKTQQVNRDISAGATQNFTLIP